MKYDYDEYDDEDYGLDKEDDFEDAFKMIRRAIKHAKTYVANLARERNNLVKNLINK